MAWKHETEDQRINKQTKFKKIKTHKEKLHIMWEPSQEHKQSVHVYIVLCGLKKLPVYLGQFEEKHLQLELIAIISILITVNCSVPNW